MVQYQLEMKLEDSGLTGEVFRYSLDFSLSEEDNPQTKLFTQEIKESIRRSLQNQSGRSIDDGKLEKIVNIWAKDIREGYRRTTVTLSLPSLAEDKLRNLRESGNQEIPDLVFPDLSGIEPKLGAYPPLTFLE
jgi:hypothetical protein